MINQIYLHSSGYKFAVYDNWAKILGLIHFDWFHCIAWIDQSSKKSKELISFLYTSITYCILKRLALSSWFLSCVMVKHSSRVPIYYPYPRGKHRKESLDPTQGAYSPWHLPTYLCDLSTKRTIPYLLCVDQK